VSSEAEYRISGQSADLIGPDAVAARSGVIDSTGRWCVARSCSSLPRGPGSSRRKWTRRFERRYIHGHRWFVTRVAIRALWKEGEGGVPGQLGELIADRWLAMDVPEVGGS